MNKICGYNCEHNKGGICQITYCDKIGKMTTTTQEPIVLTRWIDPTIEELKTQLQQKENIIKEVRNWVNSTIDIIKQQPTGNDEWILERLNSFISLLDKGE